MPVRVAVDAMGGDHAPGVVVSGCADAARALGEDVQVLLFGPDDQLKPLLKSIEAPVNLVTVHAPQVVGMAEAPAAAVKSKPQSSLCMGAGAVASGSADAFVSAGNTGAAMAASLFALGRIKGVSRPAIIGYFPTTRGHCIMIDVGTNVDCKPEHLVQFAHMGTVYSHRVLKTERPTVGLMNVGEEPGKGNQQAKATYELLAKSGGLDFIGNIEGRDLMEHAADVVICDGFVGNVILKVGESVSTALPKMIAQEMNRQEMTAQEQEIVRRALHGVQSRFDYQEYGGVPLLGVKGAVILGHGGSREKAFCKMVQVAVEAARQDLPGAISAALST